MRTYESGRLADLHRQELAVAAARHRCTRLERGGSRAGRPLAALHARRHRGGESAPRAALARIRSGAGVGAGR